MNSKKKKEKKTKESIGEGVELWWRTVKNKREMGGMMYERKGKYWTRSRDFEWVEAHKTGMYFWKGKRMMREERDDELKKKIGRSNMRVENKKK